MRHRTGMCSNCDNPEARHDYCPNCGHGDPLHAATESELERLRAENARLAEALEMVVKGPRYVSDPRPYDLADAAAILKQHNVWRRWNGDWDEEDGPEPVGPSELGRAIDMVVTHIEAREQDLFRLHGHTPVGRNTEARRRTKEVDGTAFFSDDVELIARPTHKEDCL